MRPTLFIIGSSHAANLRNFIVQNTAIVQKFNIKAIVKRGAVFYDLYHRLPHHIGKDDIIIFQCLGNGLFKKWLKPGVRNVKLDYSTGKKIIHLREFLPSEPNEIRLEWEMAREFLSNVPCKVLLIDNPLRHLFCCKEHFDHRIAKYQILQNKKLATFFQNCSNVQVIRHQNLINFRRKILKNYKILSSITPDSVHFSDDIYRSIVSGLEKRLLDVSGIPDALAPSTPEKDGPLSRRKVKRKSRVISYKKVKLKQTTKCFLLK